MHIFSGGSKLQIARSQLSDTGTYTCVASNTEGKAHKSYHLTIQGTRSCFRVRLRNSAALKLSAGLQLTTFFLLVPPSISGSELPSEMGVLLNQSIQMVCKAQGTPTPTIQWLKDGEVISNVRNVGLR